jgi:opacity protein-like surface antigen
VFCLPKLDSGNETNSNCKGQNMRNVTQKVMVALLFSMGITAMQAQTSINATGGNASGSGGSVNYSVGQVAYQTNTGTSGSVTEGVQQPFEISVVTGIDGTEGINLSVTTYPNPVIDNLTLSIEGDNKTSYDLSRMSFQLLDMRGNLLLKENISVKQTTLDMGNFVPATYFLKVFRGEREVKTFKIIRIG